MADKPVFDLSCLSWKDEKNASVIQSRITKANADGDVEAMVAGFEDMQAFMAKCVVSVPDSWLVADAPEGLDWTDGASFDWLQSSRFTQLMEAMRESQQVSQKK